MDIISEINNYIFVIGRFVWFISKSSFPGTLQLGPLLPYQCFAALCSSGELYILDIGYQSALNDWWWQQYYYMRQLP